MYETIQYRFEQNVAVIALNRPKQLNTLSYQMGEELKDALAAVERDNSIRAVLLWGSEELFGAGADIMEEKNRPETVFEGHAYSRRLHDLCRRFEVLPKPVVAALAGYVLGGSLEIALSCDIRIASDNVKIGLPEVNIGTIPGAGGTQRLPRLIGIANAKEMLFTGEKIAHKRALEMGLVNRVVPAGTLYQAALELTSQIAGKAPLALAMAKTAVDRGMQMSLEDGLEYEAKCFGMLVSTEDRLEGKAAFREKRAPNFQGR